MRWINKTQCSFSESFLSVFILGYFLFRHNPLVPPKSTLQIPQEPSQWTVSSGESCNSVRWINRTQKAVSQKISLQFLTEEISFFTIALQGHPNISLQIPQDQSQRMATWGESCNSMRWINRTQSSFSENFFSVFILGCFLFHLSPVWASKYPFANSTRTALAKGFLKGKM